MGSPLIAVDDHGVSCEVSDKSCSNDVVSCPELESLEVTGPGPCRGPSGSSYTDTA